MNRLFARFPALGLSLLIIFTLVSKISEAVQVTLQAKQIRQDVQYTLSRADADTIRLQQTNTAIQQSIAQAKKSNLFFTYANVAHADTRFQTLLENIIRKHGGQILTLATNAGSAKSDAIPNLTKLHLTAKWKSSSTQNVAILTNLTTSKPRFSVTRIELRPDNRSKDIQVTAELISFNLNVAPKEQAP